MATIAFKSQIVFLVLFLISFVKAQDYRDPFEGIYVGGLYSNYYGCSYFPDSIPDTLFMRKFDFNSIHEYVYFYRTNGDIAGGFRINQDSTFSENQSCSINDCCITGAFFRYWTNSVDSNFHFSVPKSINPVQTQWTIYLYKKIAELPISITPPTF